MLKKTVGSTVAAVCLLAGGAMLYLVLRKPATASPPKIQVEATPERLARGKYLFEVVADCAGCHSERDFSRFGGPVTPGGLGKGMVFPSELGFPGTVAGPNLTPDVETGLGGWTDGETIRAIREGVSRDGRALFTLMPYKYFRRMSDEDVYAVVAYMNSLPAVNSHVPRTELDFPVNLLIKSAPQPVTGAIPAPDRADKTRYGEYLTNLAGCIECHTPMEGGKLVESKRFAGGREFRLGPYVAFSANISPDEATGIGTWSEERFVRKFLNYRSFAEGSSPKVFRANFTLMPWLGYARMEEQDLKAIYAYLRTVAPQNNRVETHPAAAPVN